MNPLQKKEEEEELGEEEERADEGMEEVEQEIGPPLLTPLSEDAGTGPPAWEGGPGQMRKGGSATSQGRLFEPQLLSPKNGCHDRAPPGVMGKHPSRELRLACGSAHLVGCGLLSPTWTWRERES